MRAPTHEHDGAVALSRHMSAAIGWNRVPASEPRREVGDARAFLGDFTRIPVHAIEESASSPDPLAWIDSSAAEREATGVADRVMGSSPDLRKREVERSAAGGAASRDVSEAEPSQGRSLEPAVRDLMESRIGHDFGAVRVHTDEQAVSSAQALEARAYTVGARVFFNAGEYSPSTDAGRRLLAHELTHVVQQRSTGSRVQRQPQGGGNTPGTGRTPPGPGDLSPAAYEVWLKAHPRRDYLIGGPWEPDVLYKRYTPQWFRQNGYAYAGRGGNYPYYWFEVWLNSTGAGKEYRVWRTEMGDGKSNANPKPKGGETGRPGSSESQSQSQGQSEATRIDPNADHEKLFGRVIAEKHDVDAAFGEGDVVLYEDGTVELFLRGTTQSYVFRPGSGGFYTVYGPDGNRLDKPWNIPEDDIPDPDDDAVP